VQPGDLIYSFSDGIQDQFGGPKAKKLKLSGLQQIIAEHHQKPMAAQKAVLHQSIEQWKGDQEQLDDICMVGVRV
jgi:serine phosphatase RsbU (regulator of sigma subunit)